MRSNDTWHDRPVVAPFVYLSSSFAVGLLGYAFGYLFWGDTHSGIASSVFMDALLAAYLVASYTEARGKRKAT